MSTYHFMPATVDGQQKVVSDKLTRHIAQTDRKRRHTDGRAAQRLSKRAVYAATAALCNEALRQLHELVNDRTDGVFLNFDTVTWRLLVPVPWGWRHCHLYGLRRTEADVLRAIMHKRSVTVTPPPLFTYDAGKWYLNAADYRTTRDAAKYLDEYAITLEEVVQTVRELGA